MITIINTNTSPDHPTDTPALTRAPSLEASGISARAWRGRLTLSRLGWCGLFSVCVHATLLFLSPTPGRLALNATLLASIEDMPRVRDTFVVVSAPEPERAPVERERAEVAEVRPPEMRPPEVRRLEVKRLEVKRPEVKRPKVSQPKVKRPEPRPSTEVASATASASPPKTTAPATPTAALASSMAIPGGEGARVGSASGAGVGGSGGQGGGGQGGAGLSAAEVRGLQRGYYDSLNALMRRAREYPRAARRQGLEGVVLVELVVDSAGRLVSAKVARSSGHEVLDAAALADVRRLEQLPEPPRALNRRSLKLHIPFEYRLQA